VSAKARSRAKRPAARRAAAKRRPGARRGGIFWWVLGGIVAAGIVITVLVAADGGNDAGSSGEIADSVRVQGESLPPLQDPGSDPAIGRPAPELRGVDFDGQAVASPTGRPHVLVFLAHYCPHCQAEVPRIVSLEAAGDTSGVEVLGIPTGTNPAAPNYPPSEWLQREDWPFPVLVDTDDSTAAEAYGLTAYPTLVFVDGNGEVARRVDGEISEGDLSAMFAALTAGAPVPIPGTGPASER
jgi:thiol-disulfide isomerase/thioredoxin